MASHTHQVYDPDDLPRPFATGEMASRIRRFDWGSTSLGPISAWPESLRCSLDTMLSCGFPATLQWGESLILFYNDAYVPIIGARHPSALGMPILDAFPEIESIYKPMARRVLSGERIVLKDQVFRYRRTAIDEDYWYDLSYSPVFDAAGDVAGLLAVGLETTAKVLAEQARIKADERLRRVLETDAVGVIFFDQSGNVVDANQVFLDITGYDRSQINERKLTWRTMTPPEWVGASQEQMQKLADTGRVGPYEKECVLRDGSRRWMLFAGRDLGDGTIAEYAIDVTDRRKAQETLLRTEKLATLGRLAASIAHEINNPLEAAGNLIFLAQTASNVPENVKELLDGATSELQRVAHIARQSLGFYRDTSQRSYVCLPRLLDDVLNLLRGKIVQKQIEVRRICDEDLGIRALPGEIRQIVSNLVGNSLDALPSKGRLTVRARQFGPKREKLRITVADDGCGIPAEAHVRIFDPFFSTKGDLGTGLGLWVTKQLVEKNGGHIRVRSRTNPPLQGTAFTVVLPAGF